VLSHYANIGLEELDQHKLTPLQRLKYHDSIAEARSDLGRPDEIGRVQWFPETPLPGFGSRIDAFVALVAMLTTPSVDDKRTCHDDD